MGKIEVSGKIFQDYPTFRRGIVIAENINNTGENNKLDQMIQEIAAYRFENRIDIDNDPVIAEWKEIHRSFGSNPNKFPPAHISIIKRIQKSNAPFPFINKVVAVMNYNSMKHLLPVGGDSVEQEGLTYKLGYSEGDEVFVPLGEQETSEFPKKGEVIYFIKETKDVMCRRWNWRNGDKTKITEKTVKIVMNIDAVGKDSEKRAISARDEVADMLSSFCKAETRCSLLSPENPYLDF